MAPKEKVSLSLDRDLVAEVRRRVGRRELSSFLNDALERRLQADAVASYLDEARERAGPVPERVATAVDDAYARRFERPRLAKLRRRIVERLEPAESSSTARAAIEAELSHDDGVDLLVLAKRAAQAHVSLASIVGLHPLVTVDAESVTLVDLDPALAEAHATAS